jgi:hypothetical protein
MGSRLKVGAVQLQKVSKAFMCPAFRIHTRFTERGLSDL